MPTLEQLSHPFKFTAERSFDKASAGNLTELTRLELSDQLARFITKKKTTTEVRYDAVRMRLELFVFTREELESLVQGLDQVNHNQGDLYVGHDASVG